MDIKIALPKAVQPTQWTIQSYMHHILSISVTVVLEMHRNFLPQWTFASVLNRNNPLITFRIKCEVLPLLMRGHVGWREEGVSRVCAHYWPLIKLTANQRAPTASAARLKCKQSNWQ